MTTSNRQGDHPNLHRGHAGKSAESRARSLAGLTPGHVKHGAHAKAIVAPVEARERRRLRRMFPDACQTSEGALLVRSCAARQALIGRYTGPATDDQDGQAPNAAATMAGRLLAAQERAIGKLAALDRQAGTVKPNDALAAIQQEYERRRESDDQGEGVGHDDD